MSCTDGDNEYMMDREQPFLDLEQAPLPKIGICTLVVDDIDAMSAHFTKYFDMEWVSTDPGGLAKRAVVGPHRIKLIEDPDTVVRVHAMRSIAACEIMCDDPYEKRKSLEGAGYKVLAERRFCSGRHAWYFGSVLSEMPISIYDSRDDAEARGL